MIVVVSIVNVFVRCMSKIIRHALSHCYLTLVFLPRLPGSQAQDQIHHKWHFLVRKLGSFCFNVQEQAWAVSFEEDPTSKLPKDEAWPMKAHLSSSQPLSSGWLDIVCGGDSQQTWQTLVTIPQKALKSANAPILLFTKSSSASNKGKRDPWIVASSHMHIMHYRQQPTLRPPDDSKTKGRRLHPILVCNDGSNWQWLKGGNCDKLRAAASLPLRGKEQMMEKLLLNHSGNDVFRCMSKKRTISKHSFCWSAGVVSQTRTTQTLRCHLLSTWTSRTTIKSFSILIEAIMMERKTTNWRFSHPRILSRHDAWCTLTICFRPHLSSCGSVSKSLRPAVSVTEQPGYTDKREFPVEEDERFDIAQRVILCAALYQGQRHVDLKFSKPTVYWLLFEILVDGRPVGVTSK